MNYRKNVLVESRRYNKHKNCSVDYYEEGVEDDCCPTVFLLLIHAEWNV